MRDFSGKSTVEKNHSEQTNISQQTKKYDINLTRTMNTDSRGGYTEKSGLQPSEIARNQSMV